MFPPAVDLTVRLAYLEPPVERNTGFSPLPLVAIRHARRSLGEMAYTMVLIPFFHTRNHCRHFCTPVCLFTFISIIWKRGFRKHVRRRGVSHGFQGCQLCPIAVRHILCAVRDDLLQSPVLLPGVRQS